MKIRNLINAIVAASVLLAGQVHAVEANPATDPTTDPAKILVYIQPQEYTNSVKLWQYYRDYWYQQGPLVEAAATQVLGKEFGDVGMCDSNQVSSHALVWLRPRMFYNPQMQVYHGKITAVAYTASGKPIATYVGESSKPGFLDIQPEKKINEVYQQAMQIVADKMKADSTLQATLASKTAAAENRTPCAMVTLLPEPKVQIMSF